MTYENSGIAMVSSYWSQYSPTEIMSMHGVELDRDDDRDDDLDNDAEEQEEGCCSGCMRCLGLSWKDFM